MATACVAAKDAGVTAMIFGDLFLEDIRSYRERSLAEFGITPLFPLWQRPTDEVARDLLQVGIRAVLTCVDPAQAPAGFVGRWYDEALLRDLPLGVDPCGENGEFHTFVVDGPEFAHPLEVNVGEIVERDGFVFADVVPSPEVAITSPL
jgi:diphthamide synthase (EF-2-diphthine--ammonia ligase)